MEEAHVQLCNLSKFEWFSKWLPPFLSDPPGQMFPLLYVSTTLEKYE